MINKGTRAIKINMENVLGGHDAHKTTPDNMLSNQKYEVLTFSMYHNYKFPFYGPVGKMAL